MDAEGALDVRAGCVRRSRVVRAPRCWRYVGGKRPADNGGKRAVLREEHEVSRKAIAQGRPECSRCPVCSCAVLFAQIARGTAGAASTRSSLRPPTKRAGSSPANLGRSAPRDREGMSFVGWVERSETHHLLRRALMGIASLHPSYRTRKDIALTLRRPRSGRLEGRGHRPRSTHSQNAVYPPSITKQSAV